MSRVLKWQQPPHVASDGTKYWWVDGKLHRTTGPAVIYPDGSKVWYLNGRELSEQEHFKQSPHFRSLPEKERLLILLSME